MSRISISPDSPLNRIAQLRHQHDHDRVGHLCDLDFILTGADVSTITTSKPAASSACTIAGVES